ncbi:tetratricopeptide repeat protein [bacterium]|nr:tetratricopeptide repeat protein [bacterium]
MERSMGITTFLLSLAFFTADLDAIHEHLARGRYAEAEEALTALTAEERQSPEVVELLVRWQRITGADAAAQKTLEAASQSDPRNALWPTYLAQIALDRGDIAAAKSFLDTALKLNSDLPFARMVQADYWTATGDLKQASEGYRWFVRYYNRAQPTDAETLMFVANGAAQYARWKSVSQIFDFIVNTLCVDALKDDADCWQANGLAGALLLEKYNRAEGLPELQAALAINPQATEVHALLAAQALDQMQYDDALEHIERVLEINPQHQIALRLKAETYLLQGEAKEAQTWLKQARERNPIDQETIALAVYFEILKGDSITADRLKEVLASLEHIEDWQPSESPVERLIVDLAKVNPHPGYFLHKLGKLFEGQRRFAYAEACYAQAIATMPQLSQPKTELGMLYFQAGRIDEAQKLLDAAFQSDPYHVRVSNMRKVLKVLDGYATIATPHFVIRADSQLDSVLAKYIAVELEDVYADVTQEYGFEPPQRTQIEIYNKSKGLGGHQWFSARMVGLPWLQTIGASTGLIIAMTSPAATEEPFNWARVVRHEFVHVVTLQQTDFNIPHWFTEALATRAEGYPMPESWNALLQKRVAEGNLKNLDNLHLGFQRAESREDWDFAYCQSVLYAEYFIERFGSDALPKLLNAYRHTRSTDVALREAYDVEKADVEAGYLDFLKRRVAHLKAVADEPEIDDDEVTEQYKSMPNDVATQAEYAMVLLHRRQLDEAEALAEKVLMADPKQPTAALVLAQIRIVQKEEEIAIDILENAYDPEQPHRKLWMLLGKLQLKHDQAKSALQLFLKSEEAFPDDPQWLRGLAQAAAALDETATLKETLERIAKIDAESVAERLQRAEIALEDHDYANAVKYAHLALQVDVLNVAIHRTLARGYVGLENYAAAIPEYEVALSLKPGDEELQQELEAIQNEAPSSKKSSAQN